MPDGGVTIDLSGIGGALVQALLDHLAELGAAIWVGLSDWMVSAVRSLFLSLMSALLLNVPHELTDRFAPVAAIMPPPWGIAAAAAGLSLILIGLKVALQMMPIQTAMIDGVLGRVIRGIAILGLLPWIISTAIDLEQQLATSVASAVVGSFDYVPAATPLDPSGVIALLLMLLLGVKLWFKLASNAVHIAVAVFWSPVALVCSLFPWTEHIATMWAWEFGGRLAGVVLATAALGLGLAFALRYQNLLAIAMGGGAFLAAINLVDWLAKTPSERGGVLGTAGSAVQAGVAVGRAGATGGVAAGAAIPANELTTRAEMFGYD